MNVGDVVAPRYYVELCSDISLTDLVSPLTVDQLGVVLELVHDEDPTHMMCRIMGPNGASGWVARPHLHVM